MTRMLHFPLYAIRHSQIGGTEFAIYNLLKGLTGTDTPVAASYGHDADLSPDFLAWARNNPNVHLNRKGGLPGSKGIRFLEETIFQQKQRGDDWAVFPNYFCPPKLIPSKSRTCVILHDIQYKRYPQYHSSKRRAWLNFYLPKMFGWADLVILISRSELDLVREYFGEVAAARCHVVHNAIDFERLEGGDKPIGETVRELAGHPYILSVCHQFPHKNLMTLLKAFAQVAQRDPALRLYLVGSSSDANRAFVQSTLPIAVRERIHLTGFVSDAELGMLYANAKLFALPSLYEGFGMPAVEALGMGVPTLVSDAYALPEVTLGYAELIVDPLNADQWATAIERTIRSGNRPTAQQIAHVRAAYHPVAIAGSLLSAMRSREAAD